MKIIGQKRLIKMIDVLLANGKKPSFILLSGGRGSGKRLITKYVAERLHAAFLESPGKVKEVREIIDTAYKNGEDTVYYFSKGQDMYPVAWNSLLKITEEPPEHAIFVMGIFPDNIPYTLYSRALVLQMDPYREEDLLEWFLSEDCNANKYTTEEKEFALLVCKNIGDLELLFSYDVLKFKAFIEVFLNQLYFSPIYKIMMHTQELKLKSDDEGYDLRLFFQSIVCMSVLRAFKDEFKVREVEKLLRLTNDVISTLNKSSGVNSQALFDSWVCRIREDEE